MKKVTVYSSNSCNYCNLAKDYLQEVGVAYEEKNITADKSARKELIRMGYMSVPLIVVEDADGQVHHVQGFNKEELGSLLGK